MFEFIIIVESEADFRTATGIAERIFSQYGPEWLEEYLSEKFCWSGLESDQNFSCWTHIKHIENQAKKSGYRLPKYLGHAKSGPQKAYYSAAQRVLLLAQYFQRQQRNIQAVIFIRDLDDQPARHEGLEQARNEFSTDALQIVIGIADPNREAWVLNGFEVENDDEREELARIQDEIKFDPCIEPHRLRSSRADTQENRSRISKIVLERLTQGNFDREEQCWIQTALDVLKERGKQTGLTQFINEVEERLLPLLTKS